MRDGTPADVVLCAIAGGIQWTPLRCVSEVYEIVATFSPSVKLTCTCQGGLMGAICKHRTALLLEDASSVVDVNMADLRSLNERAKESPLGDAMRELSALEAEADKIKKHAARY